MPCRDGSAASVLVGLELAHKSQKARETDQRLTTGMGKETDTWTHLLCAGSTSQICSGARWGQQPVNQ